MEKIGTLRQTIFRRKRDRCSFSTGSIGRGVKGKRQHLSTFSRPGLSTNDCKLNFSPESASKIKDFFLKEHSISQEI